MSGWRGRARRALNLLPRPVILMYHRVAEPPFDPWGLAVPPELFAEQMDALARRRTPLSMTEFADRFRRRRLPRDAVAVTFDDGYLDNLQAAKPVLEAVGVPATVFITTGRIGHRDEFWWDELASIVLGGGSPLDIDLTIAGERFALRLEGEPDRAATQSWRAWEPPTDPRQAAYVKLWQALQACDPAGRDRAMEQLRAIAEAPSDAASRPMDQGEIRRICSSLIAVGAHGVTHQPLPSLPPDQRRAEIAESGEVCRAITGQRVEGFAFPHGAADDATRRAVAEAAYRWACSTEARSVDPARDDPYDLPRLPAASWTGAGLVSAMRTIAA